MVMLPSHECLCLLVLCICLFVLYICLLVQSLIAVLATLLRLSPDEVDTIRKKRAAEKSYFGLF
jgi:hypothetical protein